MLRALAACFALPSCFLLAAAPLWAGPEPNDSAKEIDKLIEAAKGTDWRAFQAVAGSIGQKLEQKDLSAVELADSLLKRKAEFGTNADVGKLLDELAAQKKQVLAAELLLRIAQSRLAVRSYKRGHVVVGRLVVADGKADPELVMAQMPILAEGYFAGEVGDLNRPVGFRSHGYQNLDVPLAGKEGDMVYVGSVTLQPLPKDQAATVKGKVVLDGAKTAETAQVRLSMGVPNPNTPHNGYSPRRRWPEGIAVAVDPRTGEFHATGLSPSTYYLHVTAKDHVDLGKSVLFEAGRELDLGTCRLQCTDLGYYIGGQAPAAGELKWEKDYPSALKVAQADKKPLLVMMTATWCGPCKMLEKETLNDPWIRHFLSGFVVVKAYEDKDVENKYGLSGYPTLVFTDSGGKEVHKLVGYKARLPFAAECARAYQKLGLKPPAELQTLIDKKVVKLP
jgi:thiol-disulfide isomerase/thioredoxin